LGWGDMDCKTKMPMKMEIHSIGIPEFQDMAGFFKLEKFYLAEDSVASQARYMHYDPYSQGWTVTMYNSSCMEDTCFFAYARNAPVPPDKGYVYGAPQFQVYYKRLVFDEGDTSPLVRKGYHEQLRYTPDPEVVGQPDLTMLNGRYSMQPRYVHEKNGKYALFPVDFLTHRTWVITGWMGVPAKWQVLLSVTDPSRNRYMPPKGPWAPMEYNLRVRPMCINHIEDLVCQHLQPTCSLVATEADHWIGACCQITCGTCEVPDTACPLPAKKKTLPQLAAILLSKGLSVEPLHRVGLLRNTTSKTHV